MMKKIFILALLCCFSFKAFAGFALFPLAVDFEENSRKKSQTLEIFNTSNELQTYRVELVQLKQNSDGKFDRVESASNAAKDFLTFSPRQFTLHPGKKQSIRVARKNISALNDGEYVTHLQVREIEMPRPKKEKTDKKEEFSVSIKVLQAIAVPVSIYKGEDLEAKTEVVSAKYEKGAVTVKLNRLGNVSSRHKIEILDKDGNKIGENDKVRIYLPNKSLELSISLKKDVKTPPKTLVLKDGLSGKEILRKNISR